MGQADAKLAEMQNKFESMYGSIIDKQLNFYENLSSDEVIKHRLENQRNEFIKTKQQVDRDLARRGVSNSSAADYIRSNAQYTQAQKLTDIRNSKFDLDRQIAATRQGIFNRGLNRQDTLDELDYNRAIAKDEQTKEAIGTAIGVGVDVGKAALTGDPKSALNALSKLS